MRKKFYDTLLKTSPDSIIIMDKNGLIVDVSESFLKLHNIKEKEKMLQNSIFPYIQKGVRKAAQEKFELVKKHGAVKNIVYKIKNKSQDQFIGNVSLTTIYDEDSNPEYIIAIMRESTEKVKTKKKLKESEHMFQLVLDNIPQFIYWKDKNSIYLGCNKNFAKAAGVDKPENIIGKTDYDLAWDKSEADSFVEIDRLVMESDTAEYHIIEPQLQADGKRAWLDTNRIPLHNSNGDVVGLLGTYEDITNRVEAKKALERSERKYRHAYNRAEFYKDIFAHDVSNLLQNILTSIEICEIFIDQPEKIEEIEQLYDRVKTQIQKGEKLVTNVRKLSYLEEVDKNLAPLRVKPIIERAISYLLEEYPDRKIEITKDYREEDTYKVVANDLLFEVFTNLLFNAVKHNDSKIVKITLKISKRIKDSSRYYQVEIRDNGKGRRDIQKKAIFELENKEKLSLNRIGLGLSMVKQIINRFKGKIWVENRVPEDYSKGSNFIFLLQKAE